jgi:hypothetical protein
LGKYWTGTEGVVELRNLSRFPTSWTAAGAGASTTAVAFAFAEVLDGASGRLSGSLDGMAP